ncbi:MAG TPA: cytochrome c oxidase assembly protein [Ktedonobacterales bacterium]
MNALEIDLLADWNLNPSIWLGTALLIGFYLYSVGPLRRRYRLADEVSSRKTGAFLAGTLVMFLALASPLDEIGDKYLFSAHMVQHLLITAVAPPLWLLGTPDWLLRPLIQPPVIKKTLRFLTRPPVAFLLFNGSFALWHLPVLYDLTLRNETVHILEHLIFMGTAVLNWWPIFGPLPEEFPHLPNMSQVLYLFANCQVMVGLGALLFFTSGSPVYAPYFTAPRLFGLSVADDQMLGSLIMWIPGNLVYLIVMSIAFYFWFNEQERKQQEREALEDARLAAEQAQAQMAEQPLSPL